MVEVRISARNAPSGYTGHRRHQPLTSAHCQDAHLIKRRDRAGATKLPPFTEDRFIHSIHRNSISFFVEVKKPTTGGLIPTPPTRDHQTKKAAGRPTIWNGGGVTSVGGKQARIREGGERWLAPSPVRFMNFSMGTEPGEKPDIRCRVSTDKYVLLLNLN